MTADDRPPHTSRPPDDGSDPVLVDRLRTVLVAHVDDTLATDATWAGIERAAVDRRSQRTRRRTIVVAALAAAALVAAFLVVRVEASRDDDTRVTTEPDAVGDPTDGTDPDSWVRLLAHLPADAASANFVQIIDPARARAHAGIAPLSGEPSEEAWNAHALALFGDVEALSPAVGMVPTPAELRAELGIGHEQFDQVAVVYPDLGDGTTPVLPWYVATGRFVPDAIAAAVAADPQWSPKLEEREHRGVTYYRWGDDLRLGRKSPARDLGIGGRLVVGDGWISWTSTDVQAEATIDAWLEPGRSLAANGPVRRTVESGERAELTRLGVGPVNAVRTGPGSYADRLLDLPRIDRPVTWSVGSGAEPGIELFGIGYPTADAAAANLDAYRRSWELYATDAVRDVEQDGSILVATVRPTDVLVGDAPGTVSDGSTERSAVSFISFFNLGS